MDLPFHKLTEAERECLRYVHQGLTSKSIAALRGTRSGTVDDLIESARAKLDSPLRRHRLAHAFVQWETRTEAAGCHDRNARRAVPATPESLGPDPLGMGKSGESEPEWSSQAADREGAEDSGPGSTMAQPSHPGPEGLMSSLRSIGLIGSRRNDLGKRPSAIVIAILGATGASITGGTFVLLVALNALATAH